CRPALRSTTTSAAVPYRRRPGMPGAYQRTLPRRLITERDWHCWLAGDESTQIDYARLFFRAGKPNSLTQITALCVGSACCGWVSGVLAFTDKASVDGRRVVTTRRERFVWRRPARVRWIRLCRCRDCRWLPAVRLPGSRRWPCAGLLSRRPR